MFSPLPNKPATAAYWISLALHGLVLTAIVMTPLLFPGSLNSKLSYNVTPLIGPIPKVEPVLVMRAPPLLPVPKRKEEPGVIATIPDTPKLPIPPPVKAEIRLPEPAPEKPRLSPSSTVVPDVFRDAKSDTPPLNKPAREVQTGGFADPNGARVEGRPDRPATIARLGSFDLPAGPGTGNGSGGVRGTQGAVVNAGFGNNVTAGSSSTGQRTEGTTVVQQGSFGDAGAGLGTKNGTGIRGAQGAIASAGFGNNVTAGSSSTGQRTEGTTVVQQGLFGDARTDQLAAKVSKPSAPLETPAEIIFKPVPDYTDSARKARDEGEVLLRVLLAATGEIRVLDVVKGLPHGLNESALRAAEKIRFKPATKDGRPADSTAVVHIKFQLAY